MLLSFYPVDYAFLILLGLGSSLHCAGMCGPIACSYALPLASQKPSLLWSYHLRYTLGRLLVYGWLGALMGAIGIGFGQMLSKTESLRELAGWLAASVLCWEAWPVFSTSIHSCGREASSPVEHPASPVL